MVRPLKQGLSTLWSKGSQRKDKRFRYFGRPHFLPSLLVFFSCHVSFFFFSLSLCFLGHAHNTINCQSLFFFYPFLHPYVSLTLLHFTNPTFFQKLTFLFIFSLLNSQLSPICPFPPFPPAFFCQNPRYQIWAFVFLVSSDRSLNCQLASLSFLSGIQTSGVPTLFIDTTQFSLMCFLMDFLWLQCLEFLSTG